MEQPHFKRVLLKLSGEVLQGDQGFGVSGKALATIAAEIAQVVDNGVEMAIVVGGGNILRGANPGDLSIERTRADSVGMLGTIINGLLLREELENLGQQALVLSALAVERLVEPFNRDKALQHMKAGTTLILTAGTGLPFVSTDTAAAIRALELGVDVLLKGTKVDGVYDRDPMLHPDAQRFDVISYNEVISRKLAFMDVESISLCSRMDLPVFVFRITDKGSIYRAVTGKADGTMVKASSSTSAG